MELNSWTRTVFLLLHLTWASGETKRRSEVEKEILQNIFAANKFHMYVKPDKNVSHATDEPLEVCISLYILSIEVDVENQECNIMMYFRQEWDDTRLSFTELGNISVLAVHDSVGFWTPDLFFVNEKAGYFHTLTKPNTFVKLYPQGRVLYSQRLTVTLGCPMDLRKYPFDTQTCNLQIESYGFTAKDILLKWKDDVTLGVTELSGFDVSYSIGEDIIYVGENSYSRLELGIHLTRLAYPQVLHVYLPLALLVAASWAVFWLRPSPPLPRLTAAAMMTFATVMFLQAIDKFFHPQRYLTALDVWTGFSSLLIFASVFESIYVVAKEISRQSVAPADSVLSAKDIPELANGERDQRTLKDILAGKLPAGEPNADVVARMAFPSAFILFNIVYLAYYLI